MIRTKGQLTWQKREAEYMRQAQLNVGRDGERDLRMVAALVPQAPGEAAVIEAARAELARREGLESE